MQFFRNIHPSEKFNTYSHTFAVFGAFVGCLYLMSGSLYENNWQKFMLFLVYTASTVGMFMISSLYHGHNGEKKYSLMKLDHLGIYLKIAGNYTPYAMLTLPRHEGVLVLLTVWSLAILGSISEMFLVKANRSFSYVIYIAMASTILIAAKPFIQSMPLLGLIIIGLGFSCYIIGFYFYLNDEKIRLGHQIWHVWTVVGSFLHFLPLAMYTVSFPLAGKEHWPQEIMARMLVGG